MIIIIDGDNSSGFMVTRYHIDQLRK